MKIPDHQVDVVFVGAGPCALPTAIQTQILSKKQLDRPLNIVMLEKRVDYQRSHVLSVDSGSFNGMPSDHDLERVVKEIKAKKNIRTNEIESKFKQLALDKGIDIRYEEVKDPQDLKTRFPNAKVIVGADGVHSTVREKIFGNKLSVDNNLQYVAMIKYDVTEKTKPMNKIKQLYPTLKLMESVASEHIGTETDGKTPVTLQLFIDKETYDGMEDANFKNPYELGPHEDLIERKLKKNLKLWLKLREEELGEKRIKGSEKITVTRLGVGVSKLFAKKDQDSDVTELLLGDALMWFPFFRGFNVGIKTGTILAKAIVRSFNKNEKHTTLWTRLFSASHLVQGNVHAAFRDYAYSVKRLASYEVFLARIKSLFIKIYTMYIKVSGKVPWQVNKWSDSRRLRLAQ